jgi:hypothetical protein
MSDGIARVEMGTRFMYEGELMHVVEIHGGATGTVVVLRTVAGRDGSIIRPTMARTRLASSFRRCLSTTATNSRNVPLTYERCWPTIDLALEPASGPATASASGMCS